MGTENANLLPATTGLDLGSPNQKWDLFGQSLTVDEVVSSSPNPAQSGTIRLASGDSIGVRKGDNTSDLSLNFANDSLTWNGSNGIVADFTSNSANPASTGAVRLAAGDQILFRDNSNTGDVIGLSHNTDDTVTVGDSAGIKANAFSSGNALPSVSGTIKLGNTDSINWRNAANTADYKIGPDSSDRMVNSASAGLLLSGANPDVYFGGTTNAFPRIHRSGAGFIIQLADGSGNAQLVCGPFTSGATAIGSFAQIGTLATVDLGTTVLFSKIFQPGLSTAQSGNLIASLPLTALYRINYYVYVTAAGNAVNLTATFGWTDDNSATPSITTANIPVNTLGANSSTTTGQGSLTIYAKAATAVTWATAVSGAVGLGRYAIIAKLSYLGTA